ncbi:MAG: hypothetical protein ACYSWP_24715 [Planctomycetota bacterium]
MVATVYTRGAVISQAKDKAVAKSLEALSRQIAEASYFMMSPTKKVSSSASQFLNYKKVNYLNKLEML